MGDKGPHAQGADDAGVGHGSLVEVPPGEGLDLRIGTDGVDAQPAALVQRRVAVVTGVVRAWWPRDGVDPRLRRRR